MKEVFSYLDEYSYMQPRILKIRIKNIFDLSEEEVQRVYEGWKKEYCKPKFQINLKTKRI